MSDSDAPETIEDTDTIDAPDADEAPELDTQDEQAESSAEAADEAADVATRSDLYQALDEVALEIAMRTLDPETRTQEEILLLTIEAATIVEEQAMGADHRAKTRWHRKANESLCQLIESDPDFKAAKERAGLL